VAKAVEHLLGLNSKIGVQTPIPPKKKKPEKKPKSHIVVSSPLTYFTKEC
jgi:hypothetical protein